MSELSSDKREIRIGGVLGGGGEDLLIGRLNFSQGVSVRGERNLFYLRNSDAIGSALSRFNSGEMLESAAMICHTACPRELARLLESRGIGCFITGRELPCLCDGKIAIIDGAEGKLIIDPCLETLEFYAHRQREQHKAVTQAKVGRLLQRREISDLLLGGKMASVDVICFAEELISLGEFPEIAISVSERFFEHSVCAVLDWRMKARDLRFCDMAEALFCAGVYGELEIALGGIANANDAELATQELHAIFCSLEEGVREANGYLLRGFMIDSPMLLASAHSLWRSDFLCIDFDALTQGLLGNNLLKMSKEEIRNALGEFWCNFGRSALPRGVQLRAITRRADLSEFFNEWAEYVGIKEIYTASKASSIAKNT